MCASIYTFIINQTLFSVNAATTTSRGAWSATGAMLLDRRVWAGVPHLRAAPVDSVAAVDVEEAAWAVEAAVVETGADEEEEDPLAWEDEEGSEVAGGALDVGDP